MKISFQTTTPPLEDTKQFELWHHQNLRTPLATKERLLAFGQAVWLRVDGELAGEVYGLGGYAALTMRVPDILPTDFYIGKITILPEYQEKGLGRLLFAYTLAMLDTLTMDRFKGFRRVSWHTTTARMDALSDFFGAGIGGAHLNWFNTGEAARLRFIDIP